MLTGKDLITALRARGQSDQLAQWAADALERREKPQNPPVEPKPQVPAKKAAAKAPAKKTTKR